MRRKFCCKRRLVPPCQRPGGRPRGRQAAGRRAIRSNRSNEIQSRPAHVHTNMFRVPCCDTPFSAFLPVVMRSHSFARCVCLLSLVVLCAMLAPVFLPVFAARDAFDLADLASDMRMPYTACKAETYGQDQDRTYISNSFSTVFVSCEDNDAWPNGGRISFTIPYSTSRLGLSLSVTDPFNSCPAVFDYGVDVMWRMNAPPVFDASLGGLDGFLPNVTKKSASTPLIFDLPVSGLVHLAFRVTSSMCGSVRPCTKYVCRSSFARIRRGQKISKTPAKC